MKTSSDLKFQRLLANLLRARFPYLYIQTWEENRILSLIHSMAVEKELIRTPRKVFEWTLLDGLVDEKNNSTPEDTKNGVQVLDFIRRYKEPAIFILKDFHVYFGGNGRNVDVNVVRKIRDVLMNLKQSANPKNVIFVSPQLFLPKDLEKDITIIEFELPSFEEISGMLQQMIDANQDTGRIEIALQPEEKERLAKAALGLTLHEAENAFARAMVNDGKLNVDDVELILEEKRQIIQKSGTLEFIRSDLNMENVGGLQNLKRWLIKRNKSWLDSAAHYNLPAPRGVLITGVPGCGKSLIAKSISAIWQVPLLRIDIGRIFSGIVGSSEENMRRVIQTAEAIAPCILWIDEIEKGFGNANGPNGDSGTSSRIFATFLTWMQEKTKAVFVVATANNISALPPEMMRKGRFDEIFFVDLPTHAERKAIFEIHLTRRLRHPDVIGDFVVNDTVLERLAEMTEGFVGAELEQVVISALFEAYHENRSIRLSDFEQAIRLTVPLSITQAEQIQRLREWANVRAVAATPKEDRERYELPGADIKAPSTPSVNPSTDGAVENITGSRGGRSVDF